MNVHNMSILNNQRITHHFCLNSYLNRFDNFFDRFSITKLSIVNTILRHFWLNHINSEN